MGRYKYFAGIRGRKQRQRLRKGISLRDAGITANTQSRYYLSVSKLLPFISDCATLEQIDDAVSQWVVAEFQKGKPLCFVGDGLSGLHYFLPQTRRHLPTSWRLFGTWRKLEVPSRAPPITADLVLAFSARALELNDLDFATLILVGFHAFLRTGEMLSLIPQDFMLNEHTGIVRLRHSKTGRRHNIQEVVTLEDPKVRQVVKSLLEVRRSSLTSHLPVWQGSGTSFRKRFDQYLAYFRVSHLGFRPYSLRRGGATAYFQSTGSMERTLLRGRWSSVQVAKLYLCDGLSQLPSLRIPSDTKKFVSSYSSLFTTS